MLRAIELDGYRPGGLAGVIALHADYYGREWGLGLPFEARVASGLAAFLQRFDPEQDLFLNAYLGERVVGSVTVDGTGGEGAHLRWFIVDEVARGLGLGGRLMDRAMAFCDERYGGQVRLATFDGLEAARDLYERHGFVLAEETDNEPWGGGLREQIWIRGGTAGSAG